MRLVVGPDVLSPSELATLKARLNCAGCPVATVTLPPGKGTVIVVGVVVGATTQVEPVVQALDEGRRVVFAGGACGSGYRFAPAIASDVADLLLSQAEGVSGDHQYV